MTRRLTALFLALVLALSLSGCWGAEPEPDGFWDEAPPADASETPDSTDRPQVAAFALPYLSGQSLDPITCIDGVQQTVASLLYEGLFVLDGQFEPQPLLCQSYTLDADGLTYTFTLQSGVTFSDGSALSANDVLATYRRAAESERYAARFTNVASMRVSGAALVITLSRADARFPALLDIPIVKAGSENMTVPPGTGPYLFVNDSDGAALIAGGSWWRGKKLPLERITLAAAKDNDTASSLFASYDVHFLFVDPTGTEAVPTSGELQTLDVPTSAMQYLGFNTRHTLLANAAVRTAMSGRIDRENLVSAFLAGHADAAQFPIPPASPLYPKAKTYRTSASDYAAALEGAGLSAAHPRTMTLLVNEENSFKRSVAESICAQLSTDALQITVRALAWNDYLHALESGNFDLYLGEIRLTADWDTSTLLEPAGALNYGAYDSEALLGLFQSFLAGGESASNAYFTVFARETPFAPLLFKSGSVLSSAGLIEGMTPTASVLFYGLENWTFHLSAE